jgi:putative hemolysin
MIGTLVIPVIFVFCLFLSFLMSGMEAGVLALSRLRIRQLMRRGNPSARVLHQYLENPERFLWTILVGNTFANFLILGWLINLLHRFLRFHQVWFVLVFAAVVFLFYALFDLLPKMLFRSFPNRLCIGMAKPFRAADFLLRPIVALVEWCSGLLLRWHGGKKFRGQLFGDREELRLVMAESGKGFTSEERTMINRVLDLQNRTVRSAMKLMSEAVTISLNEPVSKAMELCREKKLTRLPVLDNRSGIPRVVGLISMNTVLYQDDLDAAKPVSDFLKPALYVEEGMRLEDALRRMQRGGQRLGIVLGRDRREIGILTLQDVLRVMFGEVSL